LDPGAGLEGVAAVKEKEQETSVPANEAAKVLDKQGEACAPRVEVPERAALAHQASGGPQPMQVQGPGRQRRAAEDKGVALLVVLAVVAILAVVIFDFSFSTRVDMHIAANFRDRLVALEAAKGGVNFAIYLLRQDDPARDNLQEEWAQPVGIVLNKTNPYKIAEQSGMTEEEIELQKYDEFMDWQEQGNVATASLRICDEERKINVNLLAGTGSNPLCREWIRSLIENLGFPDVDPYELVDNIIDWVDTDDSGNAEYTYYDGLPEPYSCRNDRMESIYELKLVKGITDLIFFGNTPYPTQLSGTEEEQWEERDQLGYTLPDIAPWERQEDPTAIYGLVNFLTAHSSGRINLDTAPREVLLAIFENDEFLVDTIIDAREENPVQTRELQQLIQQASPALYTTVGGTITFSSTYFRIESIGKFRRSAIKVIAIVSRSNTRDVTTYYWRVEDANPDAASEDLALATVM
jgi:type II secretory pathway component PulK